jgi:hypothetical protein
LIVDINARAAYESVDVKRDRIAALRKWFSSAVIVEANRKRVEMIQRSPTQSVLEFVNLLIGEYRDTFLELRED